MKTIKKLILFLVIICLFVFTCSTLLIKRIYNNVLFHNTYDAAEGSIRQMEFNIKEKIDVIVKNITELMSAEAFKELNYANNLSSVYAYKEVNGFNKEVLNILNFSDDLASILYLDPDGYLVGTDGVTVWRELAGRDLSSKVDEVTSNEQRKLKNSSFLSEI